MRSSELVVDLFAGGGGASTGIEAALGRPVDIALNHDPVAMAVHKANHAPTRHLEADVWEVKPLDATGGRPVGLLWASPDCRHFANAKGDVPRSRSVRSLAWVVVRWAQEVQPRVIFVENVQEFMGWGPLGDDGKPIKSRKGETFRNWLAALRAAGYAVDHRVLDASLYGAPTKRRRFFLIARRDGEPIVWPEPTHGPGRLPLRTAAECIDWSLPCPSIFERTRPLAEKTLWRIAQGIRRFVLESSRPFIVKANHGKREHRTASIDEPLSTVTATQRGHALVAPTLVQRGYGERKGQRARVPGLGKPLGTVVGCGVKHGLVAAFLNKHYGDPIRPGRGGVVLGSELGRPLGTVTTRDHHSLTAAHLVKLRGQCHGADAREPMPTLTARGFHIAEVRAFLTSYYGSDGSGGQALDEPLRTVTAKHRHGLVTVAGVEYQIVDIGFRMLEPHELLRGQFGRFADSYDLSAAETKEAKVWLIGNTVCPELAEELVAANVGRGLARAA